MSTFSGKCSLTILAAVLCLSWSAARAQGDPVKYWVPFGPFGYGGAAADASGAPTYGSFPSFDAEQPGKSGFSFRAYSAPVSALSGFGWNGIGGAYAFGNFGSLSQESTQVGYSFKGVNDLPVTVFGGVDTLKYNPDVFNTVTSFSGSSTTPAYGVHAGVEIRPTSNLSLSFSAGYTQQQSGLVDSDIRSPLLPGESPLFAGGRR